MMSEVLFRNGTRAEYAALAVKEPLTFYYLDDVSELYIGEVKITSASDLAAVVADVAQNAADIVSIRNILTKLEGDETVENSIRSIVKGYIDPIIESLNNKTDQEIRGTDGKGLIFNESDGGGAKFEHVDGTWSFVGVNSGGKNGITGQIYSIDHNNGNLGTRINMTSDGFFYTKNKTNATYASDDELVTKKDLDRISGDASSKTVYFVDDTNEYRFYQGSDNSDMTQNVLVGTLPKDKFLLDAKIVELEYNDGKLYDNGVDVTALVKGDVPAIMTDAGAYLKMIMQNISNPIYTSVKSLIDIYTANNQTSEVIINIDANNNITATVGVVSASKIQFNNGSTTTTVQDEITGIKTNLTWQSI